jgi:hypothetical protein
MIHPVSFQRFATAPFPAVLPAPQGLTQVSFRAEGWRLSDMFSQGALQCPLGMNVTQDDAAQHIPAKQECRHHKEHVSSSDYSMNLCLFHILHTADPAESEKY